MDRCCHTIVSERYEHICIPNLSLGKVRYPCVEQPFSQSDDDRDGAGVAAQCQLFVRRNFNLRLLLTKKMRLLISPSSSSASSGSESDTSPQIRIGRIKKASYEQRQRYQLMNRLRTMVPNARSATTQLELLQYIIDYISDLQQIVDDDGEDDNDIDDRRISTVTPLKQNSTITDLSLLFSKINTTTNTKSLTTMK
ncbi:DNA-directed RNA polymerase subunit beta [Dirofilaria immitis]